MTDITKGVDMDAIRAARDTLQGHVDDTSNGGGVVGGEYQDVTDEVRLLLREHDRLKDKLEEITGGRSTLFLSPEDRAKDVVELDDQTLANWTRWIVMKIDDIHARRNAEDEAKGTPPASLAMHSVISLALMALNTNAGSANFQVRGITYRDEDKGDWEVIVRRIHEGHQWAELSDPQWADIMTVLSSVHMPSVRDAISDQINPPEDDNDETPC